MDPSKLVFIDETWATTTMTRLRGRAPVGERLVAKVPHGHWKTTTLIAALDHGGMRCATVVDGAINQGILIFCGKCALAQAVARRHGGAGQSLQPQGRAR